MWPLLPTAPLLLAACACANIIIYTPEEPHVIKDELRDLPADFGPDLPLEGLRGFLVVGEPRNGCEELKPPPFSDNFTKWIVLVARFNCSFETKVRNAQNAGYNCTIVHNVGSSDLENMSAKDAQDITIPSVFVSEDSGTTLANSNYTTGLFIMVNSDSPFDFNTHLLLPFAVVVVLCLLVILIFMIVKCIKDRRRARRHRLPNRCLKKIPTCKFSKGDPYDTCAICLDDYQEGDKLRVLPCAHAYHMRCIDPWLTQNRRVCPVCKRKVFAAGERRTRASSDSDTDDTEPLVSEPSNTQGGTFDEQSENPFRRAERFMQRLRAARSRNRTQEASQVEPEQTNNQDENANADDSAPLLPPVVTSQSERSTRRTRSNRRRARSSPRARPAPAAARPAPPTGNHSINGESQQPYIGVAALPAQPQASSAPHHVDL